LFITGVLIFSERVLAVLQKNDVVEPIAPDVLTLTFWLMVGILVLVPLVAIWLNLAALARIFAKAAGPKPRFLAPIVENGFKIFSVIAIAQWLFYILPTESLPQWAWLVIASLLVTGLIIFSRRLLFWHVQWKTTLDEAFSENQPANHNQQRHWLQSSTGWDIHLQEVVLPERAACSGQSIADLNVRMRYGCSIVEISRGGHVIISPESTQLLFSGDRLLLMGTPSQLAAAREGLRKTTSVPSQPDFEDARLETVMVPAGSRVGMTLAELEIPRKTGVLVAGIRRKNEEIINPTGEDRLLEGDDLLVIGEPQQIRHFKGWLMFYCVDQGTD
jgi:CPA2 family monovalent cation:H+ antiporter-2